MALVEFVSKCAPLMMFPAKMDIHPSENMLGRKYSVLPNL
jgi:hypothetical protein